MFLQRMLDKAVARAINTRTRTAINRACRDAINEQTGLLVDELTLNADHIQHVLSQVIENKYRKQITMTDVENQLSKLVDVVTELEDRLVDTQNERSLRSVMNEQGFMDDNGIQTGEVDKVAQDILGDLNVRVDEYMDEFTTDMMDDFEDELDERVSLNLDGRTFALVN